MKPTDLTKLLITAINHNRSVLIKGQPGIGKSDIVAQAARECKADLVVAHPAISDPTDFKGMPALVKQRNGEQEAHFLPFGELLRLVRASQLTVWFQDDIGQAPPAVQAALMQTNLARSINGTALSEHVRIVGATNDTTHMAGVSGMIEPLKSRWSTIVPLEVSVDDWCLWALDHNISPQVLAFIRFRPALLSDFKPTRELTNSPSPRGWASVDAWFKCGIRDLEVYTGCVGAGAATEFVAYCDTIGELPDLDKLLAAPASTPVPTKPGLRHAIASGLARKINPKTIKAALAYLDRMPLEFAVTSVRDALRIDRNIGNTSEFAQWAVAHQEVIK